MYADALLAEEYRTWISIFIAAAIMRNSGESTTVPAAEKDYIEQSFLHICGTRHDPSFQ